MEIHTYTNVKQPLSNGKLSIIFRYGDMRVVSGESVTPGQWDDEKRRAKPAFSGSAVLNSKLDKKRAALQSIIESNPKFNPDDIRKRFKAYLKDPKSLDDILTGKLAVVDSIDFHAIIESLLIENRSKWSHGYLKRFRSIRTKILEYEPTFDIFKITAQWWKEFAHYCAVDVDDGGLGNVQNTVATDAKVIHRLIDILRDRGHQFTAGLDEIGMSYIEPEIMSLEWDQVKAIAKVDLSEEPRPSMEDSRTLWLIGAYTGRRWSEVERMTKQNFYQDNKKRWRYKGIVKGKKPIDVPLLDEAVDLLRKLNFEIPKLTQQSVNRDIKDIGRLAGINSKVLVTEIRNEKIIQSSVNEYKTIHFHTGRHSYAMRIVDLSAGQPHADKFVSFMLGHANHTTTWKYLNRRSSSHDQMFDLITKSGKTGGKH